MSRQVTLTVEYVLTVDDCVTLAEVVRDWPVIVDNCAISKKLVDINPDLIDTQSEIDY